MPVVTTRPRAQAASAGGPPGKGLSAFAAAGEILFASGMVLFHTLSMFGCGMPVLQYGAPPAEADLPPAGVSGSSRATSRAAAEGRA